MQVSNSTVVEAYERLGGREARSARGRVRASTPPATLAPLSLAEIGPRLDRAVDPLWVSRQSLDAGDFRAEARMRLAAGIVDAKGKPCGGRCAALARADDVGLADYGTPLGLPPLRQLLARRMGERGIDVLARTDHADGIGHAGHRPAVPVPDRARRHRSGRRSLLFQFPRAAARAPGQGRQRALHAVGAGHRAVRAGADRAPAAPLHHQFRPCTTRPARSLSPVTAHRLSEARRSGRT